MTTIFLDIDGVLADFHRTILDRWNEEHHTAHITADWDDWNGTKIFGEDKSWWEYTKEPGFWSNLDEIQGASALVNMIKNSGLPWAFLTCLYLDKSPLAAQERADWIEHRFGKEARSRLLITAGDTKANVVHKGDILIDDRAKYIREANDIGATAFCFHRPWNSEIVGSYRTLHDLREALSAKIKELVWEPTTYSELGTVIGQLVEKKNVAYGKSFQKSEEIIRSLYPDGVPVQAYKEMLAITRICDKLYRLATMSMRKDKKDLMGESPGKDIAGYGLLIAMDHQSS